MMQSQPVSEKDMAPISKAVELLAREGYTATVHRQEELVFDGGNPASIVMVEIFINKMIPPAEIAQ